MESTGGFPKSEKRGRFTVEFNAHVVRDSMSGYAPVTEFVSKRQLGAHRGIARCESWMVEISMDSPSESGLFGGEKLEQDLSALHGWRASSVKS
ncbi:hypothetical protein [uncultured Pseudodesulfovibrio sp.]|uniref:hypothetical protein n=1 Tax=uncultured Pseudodesulfovibrio sp. TaxID=2035858 RepID=UPI0029C9938F|nr:hypothetical protein [uncultured Pseudodesulfovibrio sp.]